MKSLIITFLVSALMIPSVGFAAPLTEMAKFGLMFEAVEEEIDRSHNFHPAVADFLRQGFTTEENLPKTAEEMIQIISDFQLAFSANRGRTLREEHMFATEDQISELNLNGETEIPYYDIILPKGTNLGVVYDAESDLVKSGFIESFKILRVENGQQIMRVFAHPEDTEHIHNARKELAVEGVTLPTQPTGTIPGRFSVSRSIYFTHEGRMLQLKPSTNYIAGFMADKSLDFDQAVKGVVNSIKLREHLPGLFFEEPVGVRISKSLGYGIRDLGMFDGDNPQNIIVPGFMFQERVAKWIETDQAMDKYKIALEIFQTDWGEVSAYTETVTSILSNHGQNVNGTYDIEAGQMLSGAGKTRLLDLTDKRITSLDLATYLPKVSETGGNPLADFDVSGHSDSHAIAETIHQILTPEQQADVYKKLENSPRDVLKSYSEGLFTIAYTNTWKEILKNDPFAFTHLTGSGDPQNLMKVSRFSLFSDQQRELMLEYFNNKANSPSWVGEHETLLFLYNIHAFNGLEPWTPMFLGQVEKAVRLQMHRQGFLDTSLNSFITNFVLRPELGGKHLSEGLKHYLVESASAVGSCKKVTAD